ncbi:TPA: hypothetical protein ACYEOW_001026 [Raoultella terrigena]
MNNEIEQLAEQHSMTVEFVAWFFSEKKAACGSFWLMMMAAMWEGWKGRDGESTAALATIEKCREVSGCPDGIDLQDHLRQLAAENLAIKSMNDCLSEELRGYESDGAFEGPMMHLLWWKTETSATDRIVAGQRSAFVDEAVAKIAESGALTIGDCIVAVCSMRGEAA